jgi:hypothetical protein
MNRQLRIVVATVVVGCLATLLPGPAQAAPVIAPAAVPQVRKTIALKHPTSLSEAWVGSAKINYGTATAQLGTSAGGDGVMWGPDYGVQLPDKSWWYADAAKLRLAHYSNAGAYLGQVNLPSKYLTSGVYFQWDNPMALSDGTVVLTSTSASPGLLLLSPKHKLSRVSLARNVHAVVTDGHSLYGFDQANHKVKVKPRTGAISTVTNFKGQGGLTFSISIATGRIVVKRPGVNLRLKVVDPGHPTVAVHPAVEATMGADGKLWILATGIVETSPGNAHDVSGLFSVSPAGVVSAIYKLRTLTSDSDPGDGQHLGMRLGSSKPTLMFIDTDAVRVFRKA